MAARPLIHLDTNVLILATDPAFRVRERLEEWSALNIQVAVSAMAWAEFLCGPTDDTLMQRWQRILGEGIVPVGAQIAARAAALFNLSGRRPRSLPDCLIAATAILHGAPLVTLNRTDFAPLVAHGLVLA